MHSKHVESSIRRHDIKHEDTFTQTMWRMIYGECMKTIWRTTYGDMMTIMRTAHMHLNHEENSIWRHDVQHEENAMQTVRRIAYEECMKTIWRIKYA